jgi:hypothetical protein
MAEFRILALLVHLRLRKQTEEEHEKQEEKQE